MNLLFDLFSTFIVVILVVRGYTRGFMDELSRLITWIIGAVVCIFLTKPIMQWLVSKFPDFSPKILYGLLTVIFFVSGVALTRLMLQSLIKKNSLKSKDSINKSLGAGVGLAKGILATIFLIWFIEIFPAPSLHEDLRSQSFAYKYLHVYPSALIKLTGMEKMAQRGEKIIQNMINEDVDLK